MTKYPVQANNILVIQLRQIGDVLLATPAVKALREHYQRSRISFLTETVPAQLLQSNPHIDAILTRNRKGSLMQELQLVRKLRKAKYDLVLDFFCNPRSAWMSFLTGAPHRLASYRAGRSWWYTYTPKVWGKSGYSAEDKLALLEAIGIKAPLVPLILQVAEEARRYIGEFFTKEDIQKNPCEDCGSSATFDAPIITIDPTSRRQAKRWLPERYVQLADRLVEQYGATVIFMWGPGEKEMVESLLKQGQYKHVLACPTDLMQLAALIEKSDVHIGNCSAPRHIAVAVGTPSLTVMGPTKVANWTYPSPMHRVIRGNVPCLECHKTVCEPHDCMTALTVEEVEHALEQLLGEKMQEIVQNVFRSAKSSFLQATKSPPGVGKNDSHG